MGRCKKRQGSRAAGRARRLQLQAPAQACRVTLYVLWFNTNQLYGTLLYACCKALRPSTRQTTATAYAQDLDCVVGASILYTVPAAACRCGCSVHGLRSGTDGPCGLRPRLASRLKRRAAAHASPSRKSGALRSICSPETSDTLGCIRAAPGRAPPRRRVLLTSSYGGGEGGGGGDGCSCDGCSWSSAAPSCWPKAKAGHARRSARCFARASRAGTAASSCSTYMG